MTLSGNVSKRRFDHRLGGCQCGILMSLAPREAGMGGAVTTRVTDI